MWRIFCESFHEKSDLMKIIKFVAMSAPESSHCLKKEPIEPTHKQEQCATESAEFVAAARQVVGDDACKHALADVLAHMHAWEDASCQKIQLLLETLTRYKHDLALCADEWLAEGRIDDRRQGVRCKSYCGEASEPTADDDFIERRNTLQANISVTSKRIEEARRYVDGRMQPLLRDMHGPQADPNYVPLPPFRISFFATNTMYGDVTFEHPFLRGSVSVVCTQERGMFLPDTTYEDKEYTFRITLKGPSLRAMQAQALCIQILPYSSVGIGPFHKPLPESMAVLNSQNAYAVLAGDMDPKSSADGAVFVAKHWCPERSSICFHITTKALVPLTELRVLHLDTDSRIIPEEYDMHKDIRVAAE